MAKNNLRDDLLALVSRLQKQAYDNVDYSKNMAFEECDIVEYRAIGHCQEVIANKLLAILGVPIEQAEQPTKLERVEVLRDELRKRAYANWNWAHRPGNIVMAEAILNSKAQEELADKLTSILEDTIEQPNTNQTQEINMATKVQSLASDKTYHAFVVEVQGEQKFVLAATDSGIVRAASNIEVPVALPNGLYVMQARKNGTTESHVQFKTAQGNRSYGWSFNTTDPAVYFVAA